MDDFSDGFGNQKPDKFFKKIIEMIDKMSPDDLDKLNKFLIDEIKNHGGNFDDRTFKLSNGEVINVSFNDIDLSDITEANNTTSVDKLESMLEGYIEDEKYEEAAILRDEINKLKNDQ